MIVYDLNNENAQKLVTDKVKVAVRIIIIKK